jgi:hypothetical protein
VRADALRAAQDDAAVVNDADLGDRAAVIGDVFDVVVEVQDLARQRQLREVLARDRLRIVQQREHLRAAVLPVDRLLLNRQQVPHGSHTPGASSSSISAMTDSPVSV